MDSSTVKNVSEALRARGLTMACAESCTGGLVAKLITDLAGSSEIFEGGVVSYSNDVKMKILGVSESTLAAHGAVSEQTAEEMAQGVTERLGSDIGVSTTGIAGPGGGTAEKPVGTVCFGVASKFGVRAYTKHFGETLSRDEIRSLSADFALSLVGGECEKFDGAELEQKRFTKNDEGFICAHCGREVLPLGYTSRNHCPFCLWSVHLDVNPGDRASECGGLLEPVGAEPNTKKGGYTIIHKCVKCGEIRRNKAAHEAKVQPDDLSLIIKLTGRHDY